ncbi:MAG: hypothetical protein LC104_14535 [Bacteroidales bacterium]|nr:hypothetical protein [Bacteroidales bacterium]
MRSVMGIAAITVIAGGGIYFVTNGGKSSHCGPCVNGTCPHTVTAITEPVPECRPQEEDSPAVLDLVNVAVAPCPAPKPERWVSFDEPPRVMPVKYEQPAKPVPDRIPHIVDDVPF